MRWSPRARTPVDGYSRDEGDLDDERTISDERSPGRRERPAAHGLTRRQILLSGGLAASTFALTSSSRPMLRGIDALFADVGPAHRFRSRPDLQIPALTVAAGSSASATGALLLAPYGAVGKQAGPVIVDRSGELIWEQPVTSGLIATDFRVQRFNGRPVLTWFEGRVEFGHGVGSYVIADESYRPIARIDAGNGYHGDLHEFLLTDRGTALLTSYRIVARDLRSVGGSANGTIQDAMFQEIDLGSGKVLLEWHSLDHIGLAESYYLPVAAKNWDYVHLNSVAVDLDENLLVSGRNTHTIYKLKRDSGEIIWRLGGTRSDFAIDPAAVFGWQHDARRQSDGAVTMFDNGRDVSRGLALDVDETSRRATLRQAYAHPDELHSLSQGSLQVLPNGNVLVGWGSEPYVSEFTATGELVFDARLGPSYISYRAYQLPWDGKAPASPAVATQTTAMHTNVFVSWNGDARVNRWTALAGTDATQLAPVVNVPRTGFETVMHIPKSLTHLRVEGRDRAGRLLGTSPVARI